MKKSRPTLGLAMIMRNEAANLPRSLGQAIGLVDEAAAVDTGSSDESRALARSWGAKVLDFPWSGDFAAARNFSLSALSADYILWLDADNSLSPEGAAEIRDRLAGGGEIILWATEKVIPQGERLWQKRVFPNRPGQVFFQGRVHEQLVHPAHYRSVPTGVEILHWGYAEAEAARRKGERNLALLLEAPETKAGEFYWLYQTGRTLFVLRRFEEARSWLERAVAAPEENNPSLRSHALILLSQALGRLGLADEALAAARRLVAEKPGYGPGRYHLGRLLYDAGRPAEAAAHLESGLSLGPGDQAWGADPAASGFKAALLLGRSWERSGRPNEAALAFELARRLNPQSPEPPYALAQAALAQGRPGEARERLRDTLRLAPAHRRARELFASLAAGGET